MENFDKVILGADAEFSTDCEATGINNNIIVCGGSGSGKTVSITEPRLLEAHHSNLIVTVTKRRIVDKYAPMLRKRGYTVMDLNFIDPSKSTVAYDPLEYVESYADITFLAKSIVMANPKKEKSNADPYWDDAAVSLLSAEIGATLMTKANATFADVLSLHNSLEIIENNNMIRTSLDALFEELDERSPKCFAVACWKSFRSLPIRTSSCIFGALNTAIDTIFTPDLREMISTKKKIDFREIASRKTVLFVSTSAVNPSLNCFVNMFYSQAFKQLFEYAEQRPDGKLPIPMHVVCDDMATGSRILNFGEFISIFREKGISCCLLLQSESQLETMYGSDSTTIINNCDSYVYMGGMDLKTAQSVSLRLNKPLEDILYMPIGQMVIFRRGERRPIVTNRYNIFENDEYIRVTRNYNRRVCAKKNSELSSCRDLP